ncbi:hypothetical protein EDB92DRAFT_892421 [Lactarius akahatsu]|uniref:Yeast cell wall synthesis Kre9/Knh1-like N-terminal domain-containing protein n=1 Tax=Lactarius akahatsu TaxID=416441 RepID=A0AAD4LEX0_9AGAM|nr:hypothetical protein EDB92DRAFT_892421 [Lactarius akahatsu]
MRDVAAFRGPYCVRSHLHRAPVIAVRDEQLCLGHSLEVPSKENKLSLAISEAHRARLYLHSDAGDQDNQEEDSGTHDVDWQEIGEFGGGIGTCFVPGRRCHIGECVGESRGYQALFPTVRRRCHSVFHLQEPLVRNCPIQHDAVPLVKCIVVVSPQITSPSASTTWNVGDKVTVTWETSSIPPPGNFTGQLLLGFLTLEGENLDILYHPLAQDILLSTGSVQVTVPNVSVGSNYTVLFGDSGNASPRFTITGGSSTTTRVHPLPLPRPLPFFPPIRSLPFRRYLLPRLSPYLPTSSHAHQHVDPWNLHRNVPDLFPIKQHAHAEPGHIFHECAEQLSVFVLEQNDQQCAPCSTCPWRSRDIPLCGGRCNESRAGSIMERSYTIVPRCYCTCRAVVS